MGSIIEKNQRLTISCYCTSKETDGKIQRGTGTREETQERDIGEETEGKRQRGRTEGWRQRGRDR
jgi:hypothetical protein